MTDLEPTCEPVDVAPEWDASADDAVGDPGAHSSSERGVSS